MMGVMKRRNLFLPMLLGRYKTFGLAFIPCFENRLYSLDAYDHVPAQEPV